MKKIAVIGAMDLEVEALIQKLSGDKITSVAGMDFHEGTLNNTTVVIVKCGVGKINAALCVQILADRFIVTHVINTGIAGSLNATLDIGDILISKDAVHHDMDVTVFGYKPGQVPGFDSPYFEADAEMAAKAKKTCEKINPDIHAVIGRVCSGDQFISDSIVKDRLINVFHGDCAEMEGASIAHAAYKNKLPFVIIRAISDKADGSAEEDYPTFEKKAALHSAALVAELLPEI